MINVVQALALGIVEGFTEFLPISSTAHLMITSRLLGIAQSDYAKTFEIAIQSGAIMAVVCLYWKKFVDLEIIKKIIIAFLPTGVLGLIFYRFIKNYLLENVGVALWALALGGLFLIIFEKYTETKNDPPNEDSADNPNQMDELKKLKTKNLVYIGLFQAIAMVPGVSRAAATIIGGLFLGMKRQTIVEFSFLLAVPTMLAATGLDILKNFNQFSLSQFLTLLVGFIASFVMAIISIKFLLGYIKKHSFVGFGIYRILLVVIILLFGVL